MNKINKVEDLYIKEHLQNNSISNFKPKISFFTGAGISVASGLPTYRSEEGLWSNYKIEEVATAIAVRNNLDFVNHFFNERRQEVKRTQNNKAHDFIYNMEAHFDVATITQNIDDLHEKANSSQIIHLHGEIMKSRSIANTKKIYEQSKDILPTDRCIYTNAKLRPHVVLFGEQILNYYEARKHLRESQIIIIVGTSLQVAPANGLIEDLLPFKKIYIIDPLLVSKENTIQNKNLIHINDTAINGVKILEEYLLNDKERIIEQIKKSYTRV